jgi:hypothetical protein
VTKLTRYYPLMMDKAPGDIRSVFAAAEKEIISAAAGESPIMPHHMGRSARLFEAGIRAARLNAQEQGREFDEDDVATGFLNDPGNLRIWHHLRWHQSSSVIYELDAGLAREFMATDLRVTGEDLIMPVPSFYLAVPPDLGLTVIDKKIGSTVCDGFYITDATRPENTFMRMGISARADATGAYYFRPEWYDRNILVCPVGLPPEGYGVHQSSLLGFTLPLSLTGEVDYEDWCTLIERDSMWAHSFHDNVPNMRKFLRLILSTLLYLSTQDADVEPRRMGPTEAQRRRYKLTGKKADKKALDDATLPVRWLRVGHRLARADANVAAYANADDETRTLAVRFMVRGHWRRQPVGEGRKERKLIYIRPHWKGPPWAEVIGARVAKIKG